MQQIGAEPSVESQTLQFVLQNVDQDVLHRWINRGNQQAHAFELGFWAGPYPENDLAAVARLHEVHNDAPRKSDAIAETRLTPTRLRESEQELFRQGHKRWTAYVRERATDTLVGFTEITWNPADPEQIEQGVTGVLPAYRKRDFGHWLKAAMLHKLVDEQPRLGARVVRTGNATSNAAMLNLNYDLGFKTISADTWWQMSSAQVRTYLRAKGVASMHEQH
jgi:GNAT superfamily N-acetyltransferase